MILYCSYCTQPFIHVFRKLIRFCSVDCWQKYNKLENAMELYGEVYNSADIRDNNNGNINSNNSDKLKSLCYYRKM